jgi:hypothetical protein
LPPIYQAILHQIPENHDINNGFFTLWTYLKHNWESLTPILLRVRNCKKYN